MQGSRGGGDPFFNFSDPFGVFGGFGNFEGQRSLMSNFFGGRDPFDDPFFRSPFGGMFESRVFGPNMGAFPPMHPSGFLEHQAPGPSNSRGPIIEELTSDDDKDAPRDEKKENSRKRSSSEPYIELPDDVEGRNNKHLHRRNDYNTLSHTQPQSHSFTFQSSTVTYGGANGAYYTSSRSRRTGSDGLTLEESKEADTASRQATHRVSRGLKDKGHSVTRKLNSDGQVNTMQTLHNLNEDELDGFEESWNGNARKYLPGWTGSFDGRDIMGVSSSRHARQGGLALPSTEGLQTVERAIHNKDMAVSSRTQHSGRMKAGSKNKGNYPQGRASRD